MKGPPREAQPWVEYRDDQSMASLLIHSVVVVIERCLRGVIECGEAAMPLRVATKGVGAVDGKPE